MFELSGSDFDPVLNPSAETIRRAILDLTGIFGESFLILGPVGDEMTYMQVCGGGNDGYLLEYQEGSMERHYQSVDQHLPADKVLQAFASYLEGTDLWLTSILWKKLDLS
jgi:hypothetical protein